MKVSLSNTASNPNVRAAAYGLWEANLLAEFNVSFAVSPGSFLSRLGEFGYFSEIKRRIYDPVLKPYINTWPWFELGRRAASRVGLSRLVTNGNGIFNENSINIAFDKHVVSGLKFAARKEIGAVYSFEDVSSFSFKKGKSLGLHCLYELPIGYWRAMHRLLEREKERWPEWANTITGFNDSPEKLARKDEELELADHIFVASSFTASTLKEFPGKLPPVHVIPYGFPDANDDKRHYTNIFFGKKLKLLFVGSLSQRKGIADLFEAVKGLEGKIDLTVVGQRKANCPALDAALTKHHWIATLPHNDVLKLMRENDVLVFPSLFEGFGLVITEAMSQGMPVITTNRTAGPDIISHEKNGWLIEAGSIQALKGAIENVLNNPSVIARAGREAMQTARIRPWSVYGRELATCIRTIL